MYFFVCVFLTCRSPHWHGTFFFFLVICVVFFQCYSSMTRSLSVLSDSAPTSLICPTHMQYASMHKFILFICPSHAQHYSDIPNDPPFAGWARNFSDRAAYSLTRITSKEGRQLALRLFSLLAVYWERGLDMQFGLRICPYPSILYKFLRGIICAPH